jgi:ATP-binding cassette subfamily B protein
MNPAARLLRETVRSTGPYGVGVVAIALIDAAAALVLPAALAAAINAVTSTGSHGPVLVWISVVLALATVGEAGAVIVEKRAEARGTVLLRRRLLRHVLGLDLTGARRFTTGDLQSRTLLATTATASATATVVSLVTSSVTSLGGLVALVLIDPWLGLPVLAAAPVMWWSVRRLAGDVSTNTTDYQSLFGELTTRFVDATRGSRTIRACGTLDLEAERVLAGLPELNAAGQRFWRVQRTAVWRSGLSMPLLQIVVLGVAGYGALAGRVSPGELIAAQSYFGYATRLFRQNVLLGKLGRAHGSAARLCEVLAVPRADAGNSPLPAGPGALSLRGIRASKDGRRILDGLDLDVPAGRTVAIVGFSGSGKSTLVEIAGGLTTPEAGEVRIDGVALTALPRDELRRSVCYAFERPALLGDTVADAIGYGDHPADAGQIADALRSTAADGFVRRLPLGAATPLGRLRLSGGELQRLGLARAVWRDVRLVVLDDATSSLDTTTEADIMAALGRALHTKTRLVVAHRRAVAAAADLVAWLDEGRIRAVAPHALLLRDPCYTELFTGGPDPSRPGNPQAVLSGGC